MSWPWPNHLPKRIPRIEGQRITSSSLIKTCSFLVQYFRWRQEHWKKINTFPEPWVTYPEAFRGCVSLLPLLFGSTKFRELLGWAELEEKEVEELLVFCDGNESSIENRPHRHNEHTQKPVRLSKVPDKDHFSPSNQVLLRSELYTTNCIDISTPMKSPWYKSQHSPYSKHVMLLICTPLSLALSPALHNLWSAFWHCHQSTFSRTFYIF